MLKNEMNEHLGYKKYKRTSEGSYPKQKSDIIEDIYGFEVSENLVSDITDKLLPKIEEWQNRPLSSTYPIVFIDAVHFSMNTNEIVEKAAVYIIFDINTDDKKDVLLTVKCLCGLHSN